MTREIDEKRIAWAAGDIIANRPALSRWHKAYKDAFADLHENAARGPRIVSAACAPLRIWRADCPERGMRAHLSQNVRLCRRAATSGFLSQGRFAPLIARVSASRRAILNYATVFAGSGGRLALQMVYFLALANTLTLRDMGVVRLDFGGRHADRQFQRLRLPGLPDAFGRGAPFLLRGLFVAVYACFAASIPIAFAFAFALYLALFRD